MGTSRPDGEPLELGGLLGVGFDGEPDHKRVTRGENFYLFGGSRETHETMVEVALEFNRKVSERGKRLKQVNAKELREITGELREQFG